ncbi:LacI family DNA-binding transcriptional regulator [Amnibacterium sp.]|uniref:LacI family DNA-binding transcriptional regulator n=1 Tax=Amnibacterium sp. TaxID=1872496 RepID=UPI003F7BC14C
MTIKEGAARAASIRDVARVAGVSHQTVSRVLNNHISIRDETRDRVLAAMAELQYRPNAAARALSTNRSNTIGVLNTVPDQYGAIRSIRAIEDAARARGRRVTSASVTGRDERTIREAVEHLLDQDIEALVVVAPQVRAFELIAELAPEVPYVTLRSRAEESAPDALAVDEIQGARLAVAHLADLGHRDIRHLAGPKDWTEADARMQGFLLELLERELSVLPPVLGDWTADFGHRAGLELLRRRDATAYFCANDQMALGLLHAARDLGLDVPGDVSVVGYDDIPEAAHLSPPLTTVRTDFADLGRRCLIALVGDDGSTLAEPPVPPRLIVRESTGAPRR